MRRISHPERRGPDARLRIRMLDGDELAAQRAAWQALCDRCPWATPFSRPDWLLAWVGCHRPAEIWALAVWRGPRLVGLAPLHRHRQGGAVAIGLLGAGVSDYLDVIAEPGATEEVLDVVFAALGALRDHWDLCELDELGPDSPLWGRVPPWPQERTSQSVCPVLRLPRAASELGRVMPGRHFARLSAYRRRAERAGRLRLERATAHTWRPLLEGLFALHAARWQARAQPGVLDGPGLRGMHREAAAGFAARGALALYGLHLDDRLIAALYGFVERRTLYYYLGGFAPSYARLNPGTVLIGCVIEDAIARGLRWLDFLRGGEAYKYWWGATARVNARLRLYRPSAASHVYASR